MINDGDRVRADTVSVRAEASPPATGVVSDAMAAIARIYFFRAMALFYLVFGLITTFAPGLMQLFMTDEGEAASTSFSDQVWLHGGLDIISISLLLLVLSTLPATKITLAAAAIVALFPTTAIVYTLVSTPYWSPLFLMPAAAALAFAVWGFMLARNAPGGTRPAR